MKTKILLVDDDVELVAMLKDYLEQDGFDVTAVHDGESCLEAVSSERHDIAVLDVMMPGMSGVDVLQRIRAFSNLPVLMLTAKGDDLDRILGLELGADDYVAKPCMPRELTARVRAILRRVQSNGSDATYIETITVGQLAVFPGRRHVEWDGQPVSLTSTEYNILELLARNAGKVVSKSEISEYGLGRSLTRYDRSIDVHISSIRQKIGTLRSGKACIQTVYRLGYQLIRE